MKSKMSLRSLLRIENRKRTAIWERYGQDGGCGRNVQRTRSDNQDPLIPDRIISTRAYCRGVSDIVAIDGEKMSPMVVNNAVMMPKHIPLAMRTIEATVFSPLKLRTQVPVVQGPPVTLSCPA